METLLIIGGFGLTESISFSQVSASLGEGYEKTARTGSTTGLREWKLNYNVLSQRQNALVAYQGVSMTQLDYIWEFYSHKMANNNQSFRIESPKNKQFYLAAFAETKLTIEAISFGLWASGLLIKQRREPGVSVFDPTRMHSPPYPSEAREYEEHLAVVL